MTDSAPEPEWDFNEELGGTFALDASMSERLAALEDIPPE